mgnify:CR=1 FL=1
MEPMGMAQGEHLGDEAAHGGPHDMGALDPEGIQQPGHIIGRLFDRVGSIGLIRLARAAIVHGDSPERGSEGWDLATPEEVIAAKAGDENDRLSVSTLGIEDVYIVRRDRRHRSLRDM